MFSGATEFVVFFCHHLGFWHSGMIHIMSYYEPSPVLIRALPPDANACHSSSRQEIPAVQCPLRQSCSPGGHQVVQLSIHQQWRHEKSNWEGRKNTFIGNNHRKDLSCNLAGQKRVHLWNTSKCSLPFSPGKQDTTTQQCQFLLAKVLIRKSECIATCHTRLSNASTKIFLQMLLTEQNTSHSM